jgi:hypothetical protein
MEGMRTLSGTIGVDKCTECGASFGIGKVWVCAGPIAHQTAILDPSGGGLLALLSCRCGATWPLPLKWGDTPKPGETREQ